MGSEGYLINQFLVSRTNQRTDQWGGSFSNRMRFAVEIVRAVREATGPEFILIYRLSMLESGGGWFQLAGDRTACRSNRTGWRNADQHRYRLARSPYSHYRHHGAARRVQLGDAQADGQSEDPADHHQPHRRSGGGGAGLADGCADMVSMARPFLADAAFVQKAAEGRADEINTCIGCNQACLDQIFDHKLTSCLVNPRACRETEMPLIATATPKKLAVVGAGPAGLAFATTAASRGHQVTLFDAAEQIGGQFNIAKQIPGKEEFHQTLRYFRRQLALNEVELKLGQQVQPQDLADFDEVILACGIVPRMPAIEGIEHAKVMNYLDVLRDKKPVGQRVAIIGAGGIGFDVAEYLSQHGTSSSLDLAAFNREWGIDSQLVQRGGLSAQGPEVPSSPRQIFLLQRKTSKVGEGLGKPPVGSIAPAWRYVA